MNAPQFMDRKILGLTTAGSAASSPPHSAAAAADGDDGLVDLMSPDPQEVESHGHRAHHGDANSNGTEEVLPSYEFQPIRPSDIAILVV